MDDIITFFTPPVLLPAAADMSDLFEMILNTIPIQFHAHAMYTQCMQVLMVM